MKSLFSRESFVQICLGQSNLQICADAARCHKMNLSHSGFLKNWNSLLGKSRFLKVGVGIACDAHMVFNDHNVTVEPFLSFILMLNIVEGMMQYLFNEKGRRYLDATAGIVTVFYGQCHPRAIEEQNKLLQHATTIYLHHVISDFTEELASKMLKNLHFSGCVPESAFLSFLPELSSLELSSFAFPGLLSTFVFVLESPISTFMPSKLHAETIFLLCLCARLGEELRSNGGIFC
ncbi:hypothetical protein L1987_27350 [Smallanthus sonchifolius]|uniref:Uncharacterized protein n=1 Tax=Smallanthus sonchifolius TaxID=185202 RepID=A0ACB9IC11_9ASTR|nr:hypothetical protein L1987_27350 [Smallanthus sonchifolius]